jgi:hypothetical protein
MRHGMGALLSACAVTDARYPVSLGPTLTVDELANALLDRGDRHRRTGSVMLAVSTRHTDDLALSRAHAARQSGTRCASNW